MKLIKEYLLGPALIWGGILIFCFVVYYFGFILDFAYHAFIALIFIVPAVLWVTVKLKNRSRN